MMDELASDLFDFIGGVAQASTMQELERRYLDGIGRFVSSSAAGLYVLNPFTQGTESVAAKGVSDFFLARYEDVGRQQDPVLARALERLEATDNRTMMSADQWTALPVYAQVFRLHNMLNLLEAPILVDGTAIGTVNFGRTEDGGPFDDDERRLVDAVARLLGAALGSVRTRENLARERDQLFAALELCADAIVVTDLRTAERRLNASARQVLARLSEPGCALDDLMASPVRRGDVLRHEAVVATLSGVAARLTSRSTSPSGQDGVLITFLELSTAPTTMRTSGAGLTARELEVAELAAGGLRDAEIAAQLYLSRHTVKQYLKTVYGKLGVRSRVDLARMMVPRSLFSVPDGHPPSEG